MRLGRGLFGLWIIVHPSNDGLAWSGRKWVPHRCGLPKGGYQVCNFATEQEALDYWVPKT